MEIVFSVAGIVTLLLLIGCLLYFKNKTPLGPLALPPMIVITSIIYYYLMPSLSFEGKGQEFLGMYLETLQWPHVAVALYVGGALVACASATKILAKDPTIAMAREPKTNFIIFSMIMAIAIIAIIAQWRLGRLNILADTAYNSEVSYDGSLAFINLLFHPLISLSIVYAIYRKFDARGMAFFAVCLFALFMMGFRFRIVMAIFGLAVSFLLIRGFKISLARALLAITGGLFLNNFIVLTRTYGRGLDVGRLDGLSIGHIFRSFGGEIGPLFSFNYVAANPLPDPALLQPWTVAIARFIPSFLWADKPTPDYLSYYFQGFTADAKAAGVAAPQHVELLLQFGWIGLPIGAFLYFKFATKVIDWAMALSYETRIATCALVPIFFGMYMPTRGYFSQVLSDGLFIFGPLFLLNIQMNRRNAPIARTNSHRFATNRQHFISDRENEKRD